MSEFALYKEENAPEMSRESLQLAEQKFGFIPNVLRQLAEAPPALRGLVNLLGLLERTSLTPTEQRVVLLAVSLENTSGYCIAGNSTVGHMLGVPAHLIEALRNAQPLPDPKLEALRRFTGELIERRGKVAPESTQRFLDAGYTKAQVFEVILGIALETINNYTEHVAATPIDEAFQLYAWTPSATTAAVEERETAS